jgi:hypothetical protein
MLATAGVVSAREPIKQSRAERGTKRVSISSGTKMKAGRVRVKRPGVAEI